MSNTSSEIVVFDYALIASWHYITCNFIMIDESKISLCTETGDEYSKDKNDVLSGVRAHRERAQACPLYVSGIFANRKRVRAHVQNYLLYSSITS